MIIEACFRSETKMHFFSCLRAKSDSWSQAFLAETVKTAAKYCNVSYNIFKRCRPFSKRIGPRILSLESVDYLTTSEYFSGRRKKESVYEQNFTETSMVRLTDRVL